MSFLVKIYPLLIVLNYAVTESFVEFTFGALSLGYCGLLITWEPNITTQSKEPIGEYIFTFEKYVIEEKNDANTESADGRSHDVAINNNTNYNKSYDLQCRSSAGGYKISSLNENTLYEVFVNQYDTQRTFNTKLGYKINPFLKKYSVTIRTNLKSKKAPAKPYFEINTAKGSEEPYRKIKWYPCGKERICHNQESGTHFGIRIKAPYSTRRVNVRKIEEFQTDYRIIIFWPGVVYEVVVYSVNGEFETDSDSEEVFILPGCNPVQYVNVISLPDLSILVSWKPPKHCLETFIGYAIICSNYSEPNIDFPELSHIFEEDLLVSKNQSITTLQREQGRIFGLIPDVVYTFAISSSYAILSSYTILPPVESIESELGLPYKMQYKLQVYKDDLPIAKPDFSYKKETNAMNTNNDTCDLYLRWLPCGTSFDCKKTIPGSNYSFQIKPELKITSIYDEDHFGCTECSLDWGQVYSVSVISSIGNNTSESETKIFKDCKEIRENIHSEL